MKKEYIVLYDGTCGFCNFWVKWILKNDDALQFKFASLQGQFGQQFLKSNQLPSDVFDTLYLVDNQNNYQSKLDAVITIATTIGGVYQLAILLKILPLFIRNKIYDLIANNRKKLMGENCYLPTPEERKQFIT